ncbi:MAG: (d)CMP kinase [Gemmatimonadetes bacterium]|nr:(d)CMP kinase [Gemmatimonadota bacterium]
MRIAIDGPVASGKTTVGRLLAARLGYRFLDTGLMYRAATWAAIVRDVAPDDAAGLARLAAEVSVEPDARCPSSTRLLVGGEDLTAHLRDPAVDRHVSAVSAVAGVREVLVAEQQRIAARAPTVMVGRDIGTVVLPDAEVKAYLIASVESRALRRYLEEPPGPADRLARILDELRRRDRLDSTRAVSPLRPAADAAIIDTDDLDLDQVVDAVAALAGEKAPFGPGSR